MTGMTYNETLIAQDAAAAAERDALLSPTLDAFVDSPGIEQASYRVTFDRIGRTGGRDGTAPPAPLVARVLGADGLAERIHSYARPYLRSGDYDVVVDLEAMNGWILCGFNNGGTFTIERVDGSEAP